MSRLGAFWLVLALVVLLMIPIRRRAGYERTPVIAESGAVRG